MNNEPENPIKEEVLDAIKCGRAKMHSKWYFLCNSVLLGIAVGLFLLLLLYLASFVFFSLRQSGAWFAPSFGMRGWSAFLQALPFTLITLSVIFILILEALVKRYAFAYRKPLLYSILAIVTLTVVGGLILAPFHHALFLSAKHDRLPLGGGWFYRGFAEPRLKDIHHGTVQTMMANGFIAQDAEGVTTTIFISSGTRISPKTGWKSGDRVIIFGDQNEREIRAYGIRYIDD